MTDCFTCPGDENYAAVSLQLQQTAQQAEGCLYDLEHSLRAAANLPTTLLVTTATQTIGANANVPIGGLTSNTVAFSNMQLVSTTWLTRPPGEGMWHIGASFNCIATGAVTVDTYRIFDIRTQKFPGIGPITNTIVSTQYEPNNGTGVDISFSTVFPLTATDEVQLRFLHNNASSVNISIGARFWLTRISDRFNAQVVA